MSDSQPNNSLHGLTLEAILTRLVAHYGWAELSKIVNIRCFINDPSIKSSLKFLAEPRGPGRRWRRCICGRGGSRAAAGGAGPYI